jgi:hypothetical protein
MNRKALVTVIIGEATVNDWKTRFLPSWEPYARKHGYDIIAIDDYVDGNPHGRTPNWQKLLILEHPAVQHYDHVVWLDADILINHHNAPCIVGHHDSDKVGLVSDNERMGNPITFDNQQWRLAHIKKWAKPYLSIDNYIRAGYGEEVDDYSNTGVMVLRNPGHRELLRTIYDGYVETPTSAKEEVPLSWHLYRHGMVKTLDIRFNKIWLWEMIEHHPAFLPYRHHTAPTPAQRRVMTVGATTTWLNTWFLHFTADRVTDADGMYSTRQDVSLVDITVSDPLDLSLDGL